MIKSILLAAAIAIPTSFICTPAFAEKITSPKSPTSPTAVFGALGQTGNNPPSMTLYVVNIPNNITCRNKARSKLLEIGASNMSPIEINGQWGDVGNMRAVVWCRETQAIISVAGYNYSSVEELRNELAKPF